MRKDYSRKNYWIQCAIIFVGVLLGGMAALVIVIGGKLPIIFVYILMVPLGLMFIAILRRIIVKK